MNDKPTDVSDEMIKRQAHQPWPIRDVDMSRCTNCEKKVDRTGPITIPNLMANGMVRYSFLSRMIKHTPTLKSLRSELGPGACKCVMRHEHTFGDGPLEDGRCWEK